MKHCLIRLLSLLTLLALSACGSAKAPADALLPAENAGAGTQTAVPGQTGGPFQLAAPQTYLAAIQANRGASYSPLDVYKSAQEHSVSMPHSTTVVEPGGQLSLFPNFTPPADSIDGLAYIGFHFTVPDYDRGNEVHLTWGAQPPPASNVWIGLADWSHGRWRWFRAGTDFVTDIGDLSPFFNASGDLLLELVITGNNSVILSQVRLGGFPPVATLKATPNMGPAVLNVNLEATVSDPGGGEVTKFEWDFEGDGGYDIDSAAVPSQEVIYPTEGVFHPRVRITNASGEDTVLETQVSVLEFWDHTYGRIDYDYANAAALDRDGNIYVAGYGDEPGNEHKFGAVLIKLSPLGELLWARCYMSAGHSYAEALAVDESGDVYVVGRTLDGAAPLILKWSSAGELLWDKTFVVPVETHLTGIGIAQSGIYASGNIYGVNTDILALKFDANGVAEWLRMRDGGNNDEANALTVRHATLIGDELGVSLAGWSENESTTRNVWRVDWDSAGEFAGGYTFEEAINSKELTSIRYYSDFLSGDKYFVLAGRGTIGGDTKLLALRMPLTGASTLGRQFGGDQFTHDMDAYQSSSGRLIIAGSVDVGARDNGFVIALDGEDWTLTGAERLASYDEWVNVSGALDFGEGLIAWGKVETPHLAWAPMTPSEEAYSAAWVARNGSGNSPSVELIDGPGTVIDITEDTETDAGEFAEFYVSYRLEPGDT